MLGVGEGATVVVGVVSVGGVVESIMTMLTSVSCTSLLFLANSVASVCASAFSSGTCS